MKKIAIDISTVSPNMAGIGHYAYGIAKGLLELNDGNDYILFTNDKSKLSGVNLPDEKIREIKHPTGGFGWMWRVSKILKDENFDWLISPAHLTFGILFPRTFQFVQDLAPIFYPQFFPFKDRINYRILLWLSLRKSKIIATTSKSVKDELLEKFRFLHKTKIVVCGAGLHEWVFQDKSEAKELEIKKKYNLPDKFFVSVSTLEPRKNYENVIRAIKILKDEGIIVHYVIAGKKGWYYEQILDLIRDFDLIEQIHILGYFPENELPYLLDSSIALVYVSYYEGFGLPAIEAIHRGSQVLVSDIKVMHESIEKYALFTNPNDPNHIALSMKDLLKNINLSETADRSTSPEYNWQKVGQTISSNL